MKPTTNGADLGDLAQQILESKKYRDVEITPSTVLDLLQKELPLHRSQKDALKEVPIWENPISPLPASSYHPPSLTTKILHR
jgi:hypothetical protein